MITLTIDKLDINFDGNLLFNNFNMKFLGGKIYALIGSNGAGKTTLLKSIAGLIKISKNSIFIDDSDISLMDVKQKSKVISMLLQHSPFDPFTTGFERIFHGLIPSHGHIFADHMEKKILLLAQRLNIEHLLSKKLMHMSGGEQRLIYLAKCLVNDKMRIFLLDEPTVYLDFARKDILSKMIQEISLAGSLVIFSSHDRAFIDESADQVLNVDLY